MKNLDDSELDKMRVFLESKTFFVKGGSFINKEQVKRLSEMMKAFSKLWVSECIEASENLYKVEYECPNCKETTIRELSKSKLVDLLYLPYAKRIFKNGFYCDKCKMRKKQEVKQTEEKWAELKEKRIENFINIYLNPKRVWNAGVKTSKKFNEIKSAYEFSDKITECANSMPYKDFLSTPYWIAVSEKKRQQTGYKCELCNSGGVLNVHHRSYKHRGEELFFMNDLTVLCSDCHKKFHEV